ncbi:hypothetical protein OUZ56_025446 [Daphnia magna]|uniref:Uncharacterized protein n=1 Tax=Daphnia magna TaxID=35525 RepID=A0ABQ9ZJX0_9CRUS|nr:hypothetical protein OUZ56_025446 [Daphnia magna]
MQFNEAKLRDRKQGMEERMIDYYYRVLDLCRRVDPNMGEAVKLGHLWRGLKPSVLKKLWSLKPGTCEEFLQEVKRYQEMTSRTRQDEWTLGILGKEDAGQNSTTGQGVSVGDRMERMEKMFGESSKSCSGHPKNVTLVGVLVLEGDIDLLLEKDILEKLGTVMEDWVTP